MQTPYFCNSRVVDYSVSQTKSCYFKLDILLLFKHRLERFIFFYNNCHSSKKQRTKELNFFSHSNLIYFRLGDTYFILNKYIFIQFLNFDQVKNDLGQYLFPFHKQIISGTIAQNLWFNRCYSRCQNSAYLQLFYTHMEIILCVLHSLIYL